MINKERTGETPPNPESASVTSSVNSQLFRKMHSEIREIDDSGQIYAIYAQEPTSKV